MMLTGTYEYELFRKQFRTGLNYREVHITTTETTKVFSLCKKQ